MAEKCPTGLFHHNVLRNDPRAYIPLKKALKKVRPIVALTYTAKDTNYGMSNREGRIMSGIGKMPLMTAHDVSNQQSL